MGMPRYTARTDKTQQPIVDAVRAAGWMVFLIKIPCDLLCWKNGTWRTLECKTPTGKRAPKARLRSDQRHQNDFCADTRTPRVTTAEEALRALGEL